MLTLVKYGVTWDELGTLAGVRGGSRAAVSVSCDIVAHMAWFEGDPSPTSLVRGGSMLLEPPTLILLPHLSWGEMGKPSWKCLDQHKEAAGLPSLILPRRGGQKHHGFGEDSHPGSGGPAPPCLWVLAF